jgi:hypothetical protein
MSVYACAYCAKRLDRRVSVCAAPECRAAAHEVAQSRKRAHARARYARKRAEKRAAAWDAACPCKDGWHQVKVVDRHPPYHVLVWMPCAQHPPPGPPPPDPANTFSG